MGARISIQFKKDKEKSICLFAHWGGIELVQKVVTYLKELKTEHESQHSQIVEPLDRMEPNTVIVDFIRYITKQL